MAAAEGAVPAEGGGAAGAGWRWLGGGARGAGPEAGPLPGAGAAGARRGVASSWSGVGGSGGHGWQRVGDGELGSGTAGGSELGQGLIGAVRARGCRCSLGPAEEGSRPAGENRAGGSEPAAVLPAAGICRPPGSRGSPSRPASPRAPGSRFPGPLPSGVCAPPGAFVPGVAGELGLPPPLRYRTLCRGFPQSPGCSSPEPFSGGERPDRRLRDSGPDLCFPPRSPAAPGSLPGLFPGAGGGPRSSPAAPALRSLPPSSSGVGEVCLGAAARWGPARRVMPPGPVAGCWRQI